VSVPPPLPPDPAPARPQPKTPVRGIADALDRAGQLERRLTELVDELLELHRPYELATPATCRECLTLHPCRTRRLALHDPATPAPREDPPQ
jgi:hypothetical protein